jgi:hypothetical protein
MSICLLLHADVDKMSEYFCSYEYVYVFHRFSARRFM